MAQLSDDEVDEIVKGGLGEAYRVVRTPVPDAAPKRAQADATSPEPETLRRKYSGGQPSGEDVDLGTGADSAAEGAEAQDDIIVVVEPASHDAWDRGARPKTIVISGKDHKIKGSQG